MPKIYFMGGTILLFLTGALWANPPFSHGISMNGQPKYEADFAHYDFANPKAAKEGTLTLGVISTFDSLNPFIIKGIAPEGLHFSSQLVFEKLMDRSPDEPFTLYGQIAEGVFLAPDHSYIVYKLNPNARWSDGHKITAQDVVFSFHTLRTKGRPNLRQFYSRVKSVKIKDPLTLRFDFKKTKDSATYDREVPLILSLMTILPKHHLDGKDFEHLSSKDLLGSGPYEIDTFKMGHFIQYKKRDDYWGKNLPINRGRYNFQRVRYDYYRDKNVYTEAFKAGYFDLYEESDPVKWDRLLQNLKAKPSIKTKVRSHKRPVVLKSIAFNTRRFPFDSLKFRQALLTMFDHEGINKTFFHGKMTPALQVYNNTDLAAAKTLSPGEKDLLQKLNLQPPPCFPASFPRLREKMHRARKLFLEAGWIYKDGKLFSPKTKTFLVLSLIVTNPEDEKIALNYKKSLQSVGVTLQIQKVDSSQYVRRLQTTNYDLSFVMWGFSLSPGQEQSYYWSTAAAKTPGTRNYPGIQSPEIDALCDHLSRVKSRDELRATCHLLNRFIMGGYYFIPLFYSNVDYIAFKKDLRLPRDDPMVRLLTEYMWKDRP